MATVKNELFLEVVILGLSIGFWSAAAPSALTRELPPAELIARALPAGKSIAGANKTDLLSAVCAAVREHRKSGVGITTAAVAARSEFAGDIVAVALRCAGKTDCKYVGAIVRAAVAARPGSVRAISDAGIARAPKCDEIIQIASRAAAKREDHTNANTPISPGEGPPVSKNADEDEKFDPREQLVLVCDGGSQRAIRESLLDDFLRLHAKAAVGSCPPAPSPSSKASPAPSPPSARP